MDISTDVPVYSILTIVIDRTGLGPAISLGMKSSLDLKEAIVGAIEELFHSRFWIRDIMSKKELKEYKKIWKRKHYISNLRDRGILWAKPKMIDKINFFFEGRKVLIENLIPRKIQNLNSLLGWFRKQNIEVVYVDVTIPSIKKEKFNIVKVLVSYFQPLYLDEKFPYWQGERLKNIPRKLGFNVSGKLNRFPHPFL